MAKKGFLLGMAAVLLALGLVLAGCSGKKDSGGGGTASPMKELQETANDLKNAAGTVAAQAKDAVKSSGSAGGGTIAPASDFEYDLTSDGKGVKLIKYKGKGGKVIVPSEIEGMPVLELGGEYSNANVFNGSKVTSVVLPDTLTKYRNDGGSGSMFGRTPLQEITFHKGITEIPSNWFVGCKSLKSVAIPDTVKKIGYYSFSGTGITSLVIPEGVTEISFSAFKNCNDLKSVTLPESIRTIETDAFAGCSSLETVTLPSHKISYGTTSFEGCTKLSLAARKAINDTGYTESFN
jgi:hypothetical protein